MTENVDNSVIFFLIFQAYLTSNPTPPPSVLQQVGIDHLAPQQFTYPQSKIRGGGGGLYTHTQDFSQGAINSANIFYPTPLDLLFGVILCLHPKKENTGLQRD